jgi:hypothetical protein
VDGKHAVLGTVQLTDFTSGGTDAAVSSLLEGTAAAVPSVPDLGPPIEPPESELHQPHYRSHFSDAIISQQFDLRATGELVLEKRSSGRRTGRAHRSEVALRGHSFNFKAERVETVGVLPPGFTVHTKSGRKCRFVGYGRNDLVEAIDRYRP